jgi:hypothetical protein
MNRTIHIIACLIAAIWLVPALSLAQSSESDEVTVGTKSTSPVAFVYVSNGSKLYAYAAAATGALTTIPGSPFSDKVSYMGVNGKYLFGVDGNGTNIDTFSIGGNGKPNKLETINASALNPGGCGPDLGSLMIDHSGNVVYDAVADADCFGTDFQFFDIDQSTGKLSYLGATDDIGTGFLDLSFLSNNKYVYSPTCTNYDHEEVGYLIGFERQSDGKLTSINIGNTLPPPVTPDAESHGTTYCPYALATDPDGHIAALLSDQDSNSDVYGKPVLATFTAGANGKLTTTSTYHNMPQVNAGTYWMRMAPTGKLLAVGGGSGLEVFHFNGASPITTYKTLLTNENIYQFYWDNENHLYAIGTNESYTDGRLWVYTVTPTSVTEAPGSPYSIPNAGSMIVLPL